MPTLPSSQLRALQPPPPHPPRARFRSGQLSKPHAKGKLRNVSLGVYTAGRLIGRDCVLKWFRPGNEASEAVYYSKGLVAYEFAQQVCASWNELRMTKPITVAPADIWTFKDTIAPYKHEHNVLVEPYIQGRYYNWNSNSGWRCDDTVCWAKVMNALTHYSYHISKGSMLLTDLQGGFDNLTRAPIIVSPAVCSLNSQLGNTDTGPNGIYAFFKNYKPSEYAHKHWLTPNVPKSYKCIIKPKKNTTFFDVQKNCYV